MKVKLATIHVDDQEKAMRFCTAILGFVRKTNVSQGAPSLADVGLA
jgi:hypothetical protein